MTEGERQVALLRGVNVGGAGRLPMAGLRALLTALGCREVVTHIQSGNAVFRPPAAAAGARLAERIAAAVAEGYGFRPAVALLSAGELRQALADNPFPVADQAGRQLTVFFLAEAGAAIDLAPIAALATAGERVAAAGRALYLFAPEGIGRAALARRLERLLPGPATGRNLNTLQALLALAETA